MCADCWFILDPLRDRMSIPTHMQYKLHMALKKSFASRNISISALTSFRQLPRIAIQRDIPLPLCSFGTFAIASSSHLLHGGHPPQSFPANYITRDHVMALHRALLEWLIPCTPFPRYECPVASTKQLTPTRGIHRTKFLYTHRRGKPSPEKSASAPHGPAP